MLVSASHHQPVLVSLCWRWHPPVWLFARCTSQAARPCPTFWPATLSTTTSTSPCPNKSPTPHGSSTASALFWRSASCLLPTASASTSSSTTWSTIVLPSTASCPATPSTWPSCGSRRTCSSPPLTTSRIWSSRRWTTRRTRRCLGWSLGWRRKAGSFTGMFRWPSTRAFPCPSPGTRQLWSSTCGSWTRSWTWWWWWSTSTSPSSSSSARPAWASGSSSSWKPTLAGTPTSINWRPETPRNWGPCRRRTTPSTTTSTPSSGPRWARKGQGITGSSPTSRTWWASSASTAQAAGATGTLSSWPGRSGARSSPWTPGIASWWVCTSWSSRVSFCGEPSSAKTREATGKPELSYASGRQRFVN